MPEQSTLMSAVIQIAGIPSTELEPLPLEIVACHALVMPLNNAVGLID
jgi:hypothetical protein